MGAAWGRRGRSGGASGGGGGRGDAAGGPRQARTPAPRLRPAGCWGLCRRRSCRCCSTGLPLLQGCRSAEARRVADAAPPAGAPATAAVTAGAAAGCGPHAPLARDVQIDNLALQKGASTGRRAARQPCGGTAAAGGGRRPPPGLASRAGGRDRPSTRPAAVPHSWAARGPRQSPSCRIMPLGLAWRASGRPADAIGPMPDPVRCALAARHPAGPLPQPRQARRSPPRRSSSWPSLQAIGERGQRFGGAQDRRQARPSTAAMLGASPAASTHLMPRGTSVRRGGAGPGGRKAPLGARGRAARQSAAWTLKFSSTPPPSACPAYVNA